MTLGVGVFILGRESVRLTLVIYDACLGYCDTDNLEDPADCLLYSVTTSTAPCFQ